MKTVMYLCEDCGEPIGVTAKDPVVNYCGRSYHYECVRKLWTQQAQDETAHDEKVAADRSAYHEKMRAERSDRMRAMWANGTMKKKGSKEDSI